MITTGDDISAPRIIIVHALNKTGADINKQCSHRETFCLAKHRPMATSPELIIVVTSPPDEHAGSIRACADDSLDYDVCSIIPIRDFVEFTRRRHLSVQISIVR
jgi:hypothetical protein